jgi:hypothetical protein
MFGGAKGAKGDDEEEGKDMMFKPVRPRRERLEEDAADEKDSGNGGDEALGETKGRRRREGDGQAEADSKDDEAPVGWMTSPNKRNKNKLKIEEDENDMNATSRNNNHFDDGDFDDGIMLIPDLDEDGDGGEADTRIAQAPRNVPRKIPTLKELEEGMKSTIPVHDGEYDLGVLLRTLVPADSVKENADEVWNFEMLLREVTDELTATPKTVVSSTISQSALDSEKNSKKGGKGSKKGKKGK